MINNPFSLADKTILITGASSGIGKATALLCAEMGARLIITGRSVSKLNEVFQSLPGDGHLQIALDIEIENFVEQLSVFTPQVDGIVHSAGILDSTPFKFTGASKLSQIMKLNFESPFELTQVFAKQKKFNKGASVVFVSSLAGVGMVSMGLAAYSASKGAISSALKVMAMELAPQKIRVNGVCPGMVKTEMLTSHSQISEEQLLIDEKNNYPLGYGTPEQIASSIVFLLGNGSSWITGTNLIIDGGVSIH